MLVPSEAARADWGSTWAIAEIAVATATFIGLVLQQRATASPFIPREFVGSGPFVAFVGIGPAYARAAFVAVSFAGGIGAVLYRLRHQHH